jgi:hypothetical protein
LPPDSIPRSHDGAYIADMSEHLRFVPPRVEFDPQLANELARHPPTVPTEADEPYPVIDRRSPFRDYVRMLTPEGGILILYRDQKLGPFLKMLRILGCTVTTASGAWLIIFTKSFSSMQSLFALVLLALINWLIVVWKVKASHAVEIRPDAMIIDGEDVFYAEDIGDSWPELQTKEDDPDRMVICGICGTRFVEYMTANRLDENDRTPEVLAADLKAAMEQLWGRREVTFPAT